MPERPSLETPRLRLRPFEINDAEAVHRLAGEIEIAQTTLNIPHPYEREAAVEWIAKHPETYARREGVQFAIVRHDDEALVGAISLMNLDWRHSRAEIGYWIGKPYWRNGYCTEAAIAVLHYAFGKLALNRVQATVLPRNPASSHVLTKVGMQYEGLLHDYVQKHGVFYDLELYAILSHAWNGVPW